MSLRKTDWPTMYIRKNTGWHQTFSTPNKITFVSKNPDELLSIDCVTIDKITSVSFTCTVVTNKSYRANQIEKEYLNVGGLKHDISTKLIIENTTMKIFKNRNAQDTGLILLAVNAFHLFDKSSKASLFGFIGLSDFPAPEPIKDKLSCTIL